METSDEDISFEEFSLTDDDLLLHLKIVLASARSLFISCTCNLFGVAYFRLY